MSDEGGLRFNPKDQGEIARTAAELLTEVSQRLPRVPWLSNSGQQEAFKSIVRLCADSVDALQADQRAKNATLFWLLTILYANEKPFQLATASVKRTGAGAGLSAVAASFVAWIGEDSHPGLIVAKNMDGWIARQNGA